MTKIQVTEDAVAIGSPEWDAATEVLRSGAEFDTPGGEYPDALARGVAWAYGDWHPTLKAFGRGEAVDRGALVGAISEVGRSNGWPVALEYLATWLINHE